MSQPRRGPKRKHYTVTFEPDVWERWTEIGLFEGFQSDSSVARFLCSLYDTAGGQNGKLSERRCVGCRTVLPLLCSKCQFPSCVVTSSQSLSVTQTTETLPSEQMVPSMPELSSTNQAASTESVVSYVASVQLAPFEPPVVPAPCVVSLHTTPSVQVLPSIQAASSTQSTPLLQAVISTQVSPFTQVTPPSSSQANLSLQTASLPELSDCSTLATISLSQAAPTSSFVTSSLPSLPSGKATSSVSELDKDTSLCDPSNHTAGSFMLPASPSNVSTLSSDLTNCEVNASVTYSLEHDSGFVENHKIIDVAEVENLSAKRTVCENKFPLALPPSQKIQTDIVAEIHRDIAITDDEYAHASPDNIDSDNFQLDIMKEDDTPLLKKSGNDHVSETTPGVSQKNHTSSKKKGKKLKQKTDEKEKPTCLRTRLKGIVEKIDPVISSRDDTKTDSNPAGEKTITYEPKKVSGPGKKIGKYFYYSEYMCACCDKVFPGKTDFNKHITEMKRHQESTSHRKYERKWKKCPECSQMLQSGREFTQHMKSHTAPKLTCSQCRAEFISKREFARHIKSHRGERPFLCTICGSGFKHAGQLSNHMVTHRTVRAFMCSVCGMAFKSAGILRGHEATHTGERKFQCQQCGRNFARRHTLNVHMLVHTPVKPYKCDQCNASFVNGTKLRYHKTIHTNPMAFKCEECAATFRCPTSLRNHRRIHTGEKPCVCTICSKTFARPAYLRNHLKFHSDEKSFKCKHCIRAFRKRGSLKHHLRSTHPEMFVSHVTSDSSTVPPETQDDGFPTSQLIVVMTTVNEDGNNFSE